MQPTLFSLEAEAERKFREFHEKNPKVYLHLVKLAREAKERGKSKTSIELLINVVRWHILMNTDDPNSDFKINNNYKAFYARKIMAENPDLDGIFNLREQKTV